MRYYSLKIINPSGQTLVMSTSGFSPAPGQPVNTDDDSTDGLQTVYVTASGKPATTFTSHPNGIQASPDPGALNIEFDIPVTYQHVPQGGAWIRIQGIGLAQIAQAANLNNCQFVLSGGYGKGLPLATARASQAGVLASGKILPAFGNWEGTNQTLELIVLPGELRPAGGVMVAWQPGQTLSDFLAATLTQAFPNYKQSIAVTDLLPPDNGIFGTCATMTVFAQAIKKKTLGIGQNSVGQTYQGVDIKTDGVTIWATDHTQPVIPTQLALQDLIGQPTWISAAQISIKTALRSDIDVGDQITMPPGFPSLLGLTQQSAAAPGSPSRNSSAFQGTFTVSEVHHFGNFRQADGQSWCTTFVANANPMT